MSNEIPSSPFSDSKYIHVGAPKKTVDLNQKLFDTNDKKIKEDILKMILSYLSSEGFEAAAMTLQDEANLKVTTGRQKQMDLKSMKKFILEGSWQEVEKLVLKLGLKNHKRFLYAIYKQQYLEFIESGEPQKAYAYLTKRLKPMENFQTSPDEFKNMCYLLTCGSVHDAPTFKNWEGIAPSREKLVEEFQQMFDYETIEDTNFESGPPDRLITLLNQAVAYQIEFSRYHPKVTPKISTLLEDYTSPVVPNCEKVVMVGHKENVKCVEFVGESSLIASGSSDNSVKIWNTETGEVVHTFIGHSSRIWDLSSNPQGTIIASASGDGSVKIWDTNKYQETSLSSFAFDSGDLYTVKIHPRQQHLVTGGYDKFVKLIDIESGAIVKSFSGHQSSISKAIFNYFGNLIITGSKDRTVKFWDITSGLCINTLGSHLGDITSVSINSSGNYLLTSSKDNSNRIWDMRMLKSRMKLKGHQNTSKNFIRSGFASQSVVVSGSEDGFVYLWDMEKGEVLQKLKGHSGPAFDVCWSPSQSILASCGEDRTVRTWWLDESKIVQ